MHRSFPVFLHLSSLDYMFVELVIKKNSNIRVQSFFLTNILPDGKKQTNLGRSARSPKQLAGQRWQLWVTQSLLIWS